ncbi:MAG: hypothetical protein ACKO63_02865 [Nodosilinea sp.]
MAVASEVPSELSEQPITLPASGSSSRSTSNSAGTTINQQTNTQDNNDQFHGFGPGVRCPTPTLGFSLYGGGGAGGSGPEGGVSTAAYGGMITLNLPLGNRNRRTCEELGEAQLRAVQAQTERAQLEAAKVRTDINLVTIQQCLTILQSARLSGRFADACAGIETGAQALGLPTPTAAAPGPVINPGPDPSSPPSVALTPGQPQFRQGMAPTLVPQGQTPQFTSRSQPDQGQPPIAVAPATEEFATQPTPQDLPVIAPATEEFAAQPTPQDLPVIAPATKELATQPSPQDLPVIAPAADRASHAIASPTSLASLPTIARVQPDSSGVSAPIQPAAIAPPPPSAPVAIAPSPARPPVAPAPPPETSVSLGAALPAIASIPAHQPHPAATVSSPETTEGVAFARDGGPWGGR